MDIKKIIALDVIVSTGSFNKAAEELGYTQAGISSMMNSLENELGIRLLDRKFNGIQLNDNGIKLLPDIKKLIAAYNNLSKSIDDIKENKRVSLKIACLDTISIKWIPKTLNAFQSDHPDIDVKIISATPQIISKMLEDNEVEFAVTDKAWTPKEYSFIHLYDDQFFGVFPQNAIVPNPFPIAQFEGMKFILPDYNNNKEIPKVFKQHGVNVDYTNYQIGNQSVLANIEAGLGVSIFTTLSMDYHYMDELQMIPLEPYTYREIGAVLKSKENMNPTIKILIKYIRKVVEESHANIRI